MKRHSFLTLFVLVLLQLPASALQINFVQHGKIIFAEDDLERTYTLTQPVNPDQSWLMLESLSKATQAEEASLKVAADFLDRRTVRVVRRQKGVAMEVSIRVAEFNSGVHVRRGITEFDQDVYQKRIALSKTDTKNSLILLDVTAEHYSEQARAHLYFSAQFADSHTLSIKRTDAVIPKPENLRQKETEIEPTEDDAAAKKKSDFLRLPMPRAQVYWQVIEFDEGVKIQKGTAKMPNFALDTNAYFSDGLRDLSRSFFCYQWTPAQGVFARRDLAMIRAEFPEDNQIVFKRKEKSEERHTDLEIQWSVIELMASAHQVQAGVAHFMAGAKEQKIQIKKVNPERALVLLQVLGGKNSSNYSDGEQAAAFSFISDLENIGEVVLRRGGAASDAEVGWTVIEFAPVTLNYPVGGEVFRVGETIEVRWDRSADMLKHGQGEKGMHLADVQVSFDNGRDGFKHTLAKGISINKQEFKWLIPETVNDKTVITKEAMVRVVVPGLEGNNTDETRAPFQIKGVIQLISPKGGERWYVGETERKIEWEYKGRLGVLSIYYDRESGYGFDPFPRTQRIARVVPGKNGKGSFTWNPIPDLSLTRARIKVVSEADETVYSISEKDFEIVPRIELQISSKDAETYDAGRFLDLKWATTGTIDFFSLYYQTDMYADWKLAKEKIPGGAAGNYSFRWLVPAEAESDTLRLRIQKSSDAKIFDTGPDDLGGYITVKAWLKLADPTENDIPVWRTGEKHTIEWDFGGNIEYLKFEYSLDGGGTWIKEAVLDARVRLYEWVIPDANSGEVLIRLSDVNRSLLSSESNAPFEIRDFSEEGSQAAKPAAWWRRDKVYPPEADQVQAEDGDTKLL